MEAETGSDEERTTARRTELADEHHPHDSLEIVLAVYEPVAPAPLACVLIVVEAARNGSTGGTPPGLGRVDPALLKSPGRPIPEDPQLSGLFRRKLMLILDQPEQTRVAADFATLQEEPCDHVCTCVPVHGLVDDEEFELTDVERAVALVADPSCRIREGFEDGSSSTIGRKTSRCHVSFPLSTLSSIDHAVAFENVSTKEDLTVTQNSSQYKKLR